MFVIIENATRGGKKIKMLIIRCCFIRTVFLWAHNLDLAGSFSLDEYSPMAIRAKFINRLMINSIFAARICIASIKALTKR